MSFMELHDEAMAVVDEARAHERNGDKESYIHLLLKACQLEEKAARFLNRGPESEPTRSVLFRSASSLAFQAEDYHQACTLAFEGLTGDTPEECIAELLDIANDAKFRLRLREQDLQVAKSEITVIVRGPRVAIGLAPAKQTTLMLRRIENLLRNCIEDFFRNKIAEVESDGQIESMKIFEVFLRQLPTEEFAVAFRLGLSEQLHLFGPVSLGDRIVTQFMRDLQVAVDQAPGTENRDKFTKAVAKLEPDGKEVTSVEINSLVAGVLMSVRIPPKKQAGREGLGPEVRRKPNW